VTRPIILFIGLYLSLIVTGAFLSKILSFLRLDHLSQDAEVS
jgi:hypothetical protein